MSSLPKPRLFTDEEYLILEERAEFRSQFYDGEIFAMAGANRRDNLISTNIAANLHAQFRGRPCEVYQNDMRVKVHKNFYTYPDIVIVCGVVAFGNFEFRRISKVRLDFLDSEIIGHLRTN
jgi:Uma2 family endonuclease